MKKIGIISVLLGILAFMLGGCQKQEGTNTKENVKTVGIVQIVEHTSLDTIRESILQELADLGYVEGENIVIDYQNAQGDQSNLNAICKRFVDKKVDLIVAIATPSAQAAMGATDTIPIVFSAVTDPVAAELVESLEKPGMNATGTSDAIPVDQVFELSKELTPEVKTFGFLYTASEINSKSVVDEAKALAADYGFEYEEMTLTNSSELAQAAESLAGKVDAIYTPIDNTIASAMTLLAEIGRENKIPLYVGADSMVMDGGYATVGINYSDLGKKTAEMVDRVLKGENPKDMPVETLDTFDKVINKTTAEMIGAKAETEGAIIVE